MDNVNQGSPIYHIVEVEMPEGPARFYASIEAQAPHFGRPPIGPYESAESLKANWESNRQKAPGATLAADVIKSHHYLDKDFFWHWQTFSLSVFFGIPRDEFTERLTPGIPSGPEGIALRDELEFEFQTNPNAVEKYVLEVKLESLRVLVPTERTRDAQSHVPLMLPVRAQFRYPASFVGALEYLQKHVTPRFTIPFLGIESIPGALNWVK